MNVMFDTIWKFPLLVQDEQEIEMPLAYKVLDVQAQHGAAFLWAIVDSQSPKAKAAVYIRGTGHLLRSDDMEGPVEHVGTFQLMGGGLVFHAFMKKQRLG